MEQRRGGNIVPAYVLRCLNKNQQRVFFCLREFYIRCISLLRNSSKDTSRKWTTTDREHRKFDDRVRGILNFNNQVTEDGRREGTKRGKRGW